MSDHQKESGEKKTYYVSPCISVHCICPLITAIYIINIIVFLSS